MVPYTDQLQSFNTPNFAMVLLDSVSKIKFVLLQYGLLFCTSLQFVSLIRHEVLRR